MSLIKFFLGLSALIVATTVCAQQFTMTGLERSGGDVIINYDLLDTVSHRNYTIHLYHSLDDYINPLKAVEGDVGIDIPIGKNKQIIWHAQKELGSDFNGTIHLEVRGHVYIPFIRLNGFDDYQSFTLKKPYRISWTGGRGNQLLDFILYRNDQRITSFSNIANVGEYELVFSGVKPGKDYYFIIEDQKNKDEVIITESFAIKPGLLPSLLKVSGALGAGAIVAAILLSEDPIPEPIDP